MGILQARILELVVMPSSGNVPLISLISLKRSLVFPILLFPSVSLHCSLKNILLSLLTILWNSAFRWVCLSFPPLTFCSLLFSAICKASSDNHFALWFFFFLGMILVTASCTVLWISICVSSGTLSIRSNPLNLLVTSTGTYVILYINYMLIQGKQNTCCLP